jgi:hypothetical protein
MTTATVQPALAPSKTTGPGSASADIDTRLMLAQVFMDVVLGSDQAVQDAHKAVADAIAAAGRYSDQSASLKDHTAPTVTFTSHPVLKLAGDIVRSRGWAQQVFTDQQGAVCAWQAIRLAAVGFGQEASAVTELLARIRHDLGQSGSGYSIPGWNDSRRTSQDVLRLLW